MIFADPFTGIAGPRADRFRIGDQWRGPNGITYLVRRGIAEKAVCLHPIVGGSRLHLRRESVDRFQRVQWGGQP